VSDFAKALRGTMARPNSGFEQAKADLRAETGAASEAVQNYTNGLGHASPTTHPYPKALLPTGTCSAAGVGRPARIDWRAKREPCGRG
jgi:hypothetical protein